jgi:hypothetical protein
MCIRASVRALVFICTPACVLVSHMQPYICDRCVYVYPCLRACACVHLHARMCTCVALCDFTFEIKVTVLTHVPPCVRLCSFARPHVYLCYIV